MMEKDTLIKDIRIGDLFYRVDYISPRLRHKGIKNVLLTMVVGVNQVYRTIDMLTIWSPYHSSKDRERHGSTWIKVGEVFPVFYVKRTHPTKVGEYVDCLNGFDWSRP